MTTSAVEGSTAIKTGGVPARVFRICGLTLLWLVLGVCVVWAAAALYFDVRVPWLRIPLALGFIAALVIGCVLVKGVWRKLIVPAVGFVIVLGWWLSLRPSNDRNWQPDLKVLGYANVKGDNVTIHNIRNCDYRSETDFDVRYYDKQFDLQKLRSADLFMVYWGSPHMAHTMVSFGFEGGAYVCFSIETRKEQGEGYSAIKGLFRQFELMYVVADERDVVRLRTNYRKGEEAYLYRLNGSPERLREFFLDYVNRLNSLHERAQWYSAITQNCTTSIRSQNTTGKRAPWDWRMLVNGHGDELLYERGTIATNLPLAELKERCHINERARAAGDAEDFSRLIRVGVPGTGL